MAKIAPINNSISNNYNGTLHIDAPSNVQPLPQSALLLREYREKGLLKSAEGTI